MTCNQQKCKNEIDQSLLLLLDVSKCILYKLLVFLKIISEIVVKITLVAYRLKTQKLGGGYMSIAQLTPCDHPFKL